MSVKFPLKGKLATLVYICSKKIISIVKCNIIKTWWWILLCKLSSFVSSKNFINLIEVESHKKVYENKDFCDVVMPSEDTKILEFVNLIKHHLLFIQIEKIDGWKNNLGKSSTTKLGEDIRSGFLMSTKLPFKSILNNHGT